MTKLSTEAQERVNKTFPKPQTVAVKLFMGLLDVVAVVILLGLAIIGARSLIDANLGKEVVLGIAIAIVGLLASRIVERVFQARR